jgi:F-type H+-transporting ATPase subunit a
VANPIAQFVIENKAPLTIGNIDVSFTNSAMWMVVALVVSVVFLAISSSKKSIIPGRMQASGEMLYMFVADMVRDTIGAKGARYFPFVFTLFIFVLMGNLLGLMPYSFTYTSHLAVTGGLALIVFVMVIIFGFLNHGFKFLSLFAPAGVPWFIYPVLVPIEIISFFVRPLTLSVRLFANMMAGHIMLKVVAGFAVGAASMGAGFTVLGIFPVFINMMLIAFELLVAVIQAYVFAILTCVYLKDTVDLHH